MSVERKKQIKLLSDNIQHGKPDRNPGKMFADIILWWALMVFWG